MGSSLELNDTLLLTETQGFPSSILDRSNPGTLKDVADRIFEFKDKDGARVFHLEPVRVYLVENVDGKWIFWGKAFVVSQTIAKKLAANSDWKPGDWVTSGKFKIVDVFEPEYQRIFTQRESPPGKSFF